MKIRLLIAALLMSFTTSAMAVMIPIDGEVIFHNNPGNDHWGLNLWDEVHFVADTGAPSPLGVPFEQLPLLTSRPRPALGTTDGPKVCGVRWSATKAFLRPALARPNLTVMTDVHVERVQLAEELGEPLPRC